MAIAPTDTQAYRRTEPAAASSWLDAQVSTHRDLILLLARLALAYIFIESALNHAGDLSKFAATFKNFQLPAPLGVPMAGLAVLVELVGGIALVAGYRIRETAVLMIVFLLVTIFVGHRFWEFEDAARRMHIIQIKKNVAITGGFLLLLVVGGGRYAVSAWRQRRDGA